MKHVPKVAFLGLAIFTLGSCATQSSPIAAQPSCCVKAEAPAAFTDKSIYQTESTWTTDSEKHIKLSALAGRPQVIAMFFANCQFACPIIVNDMKRIEAALPAQLRGSVGFTLVSFDSERDTPAALAECRRTRDLPPKNWTLMRRSLRTWRLTCRSWPIYSVSNLRRTPQGNSPTRTSLSILNAQGEIVHQQVGLNQDIQETIRLLQKLATINGN